MYQQEHHSNCIYSLFVLYHKKRNFEWVSSIDQCHISMNAYFIKTYSYFILVYLRLVYRISELVVLNINLTDDITLRTTLTLKSRPLRFAIPRNVPGIISLIRFRLRSKYSNEDNA